MGASSGRWPKLAITGNWLLLFLVGTRHSNPVVEEGFNDSGKAVCSPFTPGEITDPIALRTCAINSGASHMSAQISAPIRF